MNKFEIDMTFHRAEKELDKMIEYREEVDSNKRLGYTFFNFFLVSLTKTSLDQIGFF